MSDYNNMSDYKSVLQNYSSINDYTLLLHYINSFHVVDSIMHKNKVDGEKLLRFLNKSSNQQSTIFHVVSYF